MSGLLFLALLQPAAAPVMGWVATPDSARQIADMLSASGLRNAGYRFILLDGAPADLQALADHVRSRGIMLCSAPAQPGCPAFRKLDDSGYSAIEYRSQITQRALSTDPLLVAYDLRKAKPEFLNILFNRDVIALHQDSLGRPAERLLNDGDAEVWVKPLAGGDQAIALFNRGNSPREISTLVPYPSRIVDLWSRREVHMPTEEFSAWVPAHGVVLLRATPLTGPEPR